jgi:hypothetical protein
VISPAEAGPSLDEIAGEVASGICAAAFSALGMTPQALDLAAEAVLATDAIAGSAESMLAGKD